MATTVTVTYPLNLLPILNPPTGPCPPSFVLTKSSLTITYPVPGSDDLDNMTVGALLDMGLSFSEYQTYQDSNRSGKYKSGPLSVTIKGATLHGKPLKMDWLCEDVGIVNATALTVTDVDVNGKVKAHRSASFTQMERLVDKGEEVKVREVSTRAERAHGTVFSFQGKQHPAHIHTQLTLAHVSSSLFTDTGHRL